MKRHQLAHFLGAALRDRDMSSIEWALKQSRNDFTWSHRLGLCPAHKALARNLRAEGLRLRPQRSRPVAVASVLHQVTVEIWRTIVPPRRAPLAQSDLGSVDGGPCQLHVSLARLGALDPSPGVHELPDKPLPLAIWYRRIRRPPDPTEVGELIAFLVSGSSTFTTGEVIGFTVSWP